MLKISKEKEKILNSPVPREQVKEISFGNGKAKKYVSGNYVKDMLNKVFGHGAWTYTYKLSTITRLHPATDVKEVQGYQADVVLTVWDDGNSIVREEIGTCAFNAKAYDYIGETDKSRKGAITDGLKRCAVGFGSCFGLHIADMEEEKEVEK